MLYEVDCRYEVKCKQTPSSRLLRPNALRLLIRSTHYRVLVGAPLAVSDSYAHWARGVDLNDIFDSLDKMGWGANCDTPTTEGGNQDYDDLVLQMETLPTTPPE